MVYRVLILFVFSLGMAQTEVEIDSIRFTGNTAYSDNQLRALLRSEIDEPYQAFLARSDQQSILNFYRANGYIEAEVITRLLPVRNNPQRRIMVFQIRENVQTRFGRIRITGNYSQPDSVYLRFFDAKSGDPFQEASLFALENEILRIYEDNGRLFTQVTISHRPRPGNRFVRDVIVTIRESGIFYVRNVKIVSQDSTPLITKPDVIREELEFMRGDVVSQSAIRQTRRSLQEQQLYQSVQITTPSGFRADSTAATDSIDIEIRIRERKPNYIGLSAGISTLSNDRFVDDRSESDVFLEKLNYELNVDLGKRNWRGEGIDVGLLFNPVWYFDRNGSFSNYSINTQLYSRIVNFPFRHFHSNWDINYRIINPAFGDLTRFQFNYLTTNRLGPRSAIDFVLNFDVNDLAVEPEYLEDVNVIKTLGLNDYNIFAVGLNLRRDERTNILNPTDGFYLIGGFKFSTANVIQESDISYFTMNLEWRRYQPLAPDAFGIDLILATNVKYSGILTTTGDTEIDPIPSPERLFMGASIRGYQSFRFGALNRVIDPSIASADSVQFYPVGGKSLFASNIELRYHIGKQIKGTLVDRWTGEWMEHFYMQTFVDAGGLWQSFSAMRWDNVRVGYGGGLSYNFGVLLARVDVGFKLRTRALNVINISLDDDIEIPTENPYNFSFGISYHF